MLDSPASVSLQPICPTNRVFDIDAALLLDDAAANAFLSAQPIPENARLVTYGSQELLQTFTARYFRPKPSAHPTG
jgi:hypothetical protein